MEAFLSLLPKHNAFNVLRASIEKNARPRVCGVSRTQKLHLMWGAGKLLNKNVLIITSTELEANKTASDAGFFFGCENVFAYPASDAVFLSAGVYSHENEAIRLRAVHALMTARPPCAVVLSAEALTGGVVSKKDFLSAAFTIKPNDTVNLNALPKILTFLGYQRGLSAADAASGAYEIRGGVCDIYSRAYGVCYRVDFFGETIESIRVIDPETNRAAERVNEARIFPVCEIPYSEKQLENAKNAARASFNERRRELGAQNDAERLSRLSSGVKPFLDGAPFNANAFSPFLAEKTVNVLDYISRETIVFVCEPVNVNENLNAAYQEGAAILLDRAEKGFILPEQAHILTPPVYTQKRLLELNTVYLSEIGRFSPDGGVLIDFGAQNADTSFKGRHGAFFAELSERVKSGETAFFICETPEKAKKLAALLNENGVNAAYAASLNKAFPPGAYTAAGGLSTGFSYPGIGFNIYAESDIFHTHRVKRQKTPKKPFDYFDLTPGDYVVHSSHGIGVFRGVEKIVSDGVTKDYLKLSYRDGGTLYVPVTNADCVNRYFGAGDEAPKLNALGGAEWNKTKQRAKEAVAIAARDLAKVYAERQGAVGFAFSKDTVWQTEFENSFPYEETPDQLRAIEEIKADMEQPKPMDRLLCGDSGYGKTEVALRAAFKAAQDGKQTVFLAPTTILALQHYNTIVERVKNYPINVELLSRFVSANAAKKAKERIASGECDIIVGTQAVLADSVKYHDLALVIIDEEQRFGVAQKEKLKALKKGVDTLALTATPIPRTLHLSLTALRDLSVLNTPPDERNPVSTYLFEYDEALVRMSISRELARGGQVFYLYNRIAGIDGEAARLREILPGVTFAVAHGRMAEKDLVNVTESFIKGDIGVLVCTTIVETGLDIANVNTIIINNADMFGLSSLYQLRGRVGRSNKYAYAYLLYKKNKILDEAAEKRLKAIAEFTGFGAGFKIALKDLEIRGAGNLLGAEQHGHMVGVGFEMYNSMLNEALSELAGQKTEESFETLIDIKINAHIPAFYIENEAEKLEVYKKIANIGAGGGAQELIDEITDRFGQIPKSVNNLIEVARARAAAHEKRICQITEKQDAYIFVFEKNANISPDAVIALINSNKGRVFFTNAEKPYLTYKKNPNEAGAAGIFAVLGQL